MALTSTPTDHSPAVIKQSSPAKYVDLNDFLNVIPKPDNRADLVKAFGDQGITGFLEIVGAVTNVGEADEVTFWEETRLHPVQLVHLAATAASALTKTYTASGSVVVRANDVILLEDGSTRAYVTAVSSTGYAVAAFDSDAPIPAIGATGYTEHKIIGNSYGQGTDQPSEYFESNVVRRTNPFMIIKDIYKVTGSQATNKSWVKLPNGQEYWYLKAQEDMNKRFKNWRETMLVAGELVKGSATANITTIDGSEGLFSAIQDRGIVAPSFVATTGLALFDELIEEYDVQGAACDEYMGFFTTSLMLAFDGMLAYGLASSMTNGLPSQFGNFANSEQMAVNLGFKSFTRGGRTFHNKRWKLLNDPTLLGGTDFKGVLIPTGMAVDAKTGKSVPVLEMNYKSGPNENRLMKSWATESVLGARTGTKDIAQINYLSEVNLVTRAANQYTLFKA